MYLIIFDDGTINKTPKYLPEDITMVDYGYISLIDISNPEKPMEYCNGVWIDIEYSDERDS